MFSVYSGYKKVETGSKKYFFAGANTADGFVGTYSNIADERKLDRVYIIKGASGTGKSTLMKTVAEAAENEGFSSEYYLCGSDPFSLDCVVIGGRIAILDGTAPHIRDMNYPGAKSSIIDLSKFWDDHLLEARKDELISYSVKKSMAYSSAYRYIKAADVIEKERYALSREFFDFEKAGGSIERLLKKHIVKPSENSEIKKLYSHAITMRGKWYVDTAECCSGEIYYLNDPFGCAPLFMELVNEVVSTRGINATVTYMPLRENITSVLLDDYGILITAAETAKEAKNINLTRFIKGEKCDEYKGRVRLAGKCEKECLEDAENCLTYAADNHFLIEEIYKASMDFSSLGKYTDSICKEIIAKLKKQR